MLSRIAWRSDSEGPAGCWWPCDRDDGPAGDTDAGECECWGVDGFDDDATSC